MNYINLAHAAITKLIEILEKLQTSMARFQNQMVQKEREQQIQYQPRRKFGFVRK